jgi:hypothetical protein
MMHFDVYSFIMKQPIEKSSDSTEPPSDRVLTIRVAPALYDAVVAEAQAGRHSINTASTILLEQALEARGKWPPTDTKTSGAKIPVWRRPK